MKKDRQMKLFNSLANALNNGYTYEIIYDDIFRAFYSKTALSFSKYNGQYNTDRNLLQQGVMYYHKELKLMNSLPVVAHDIDKGTLTSSKVEYYLEPRASYTISDLLEYFYSKGMADTDEYNPKRMAGMFRHKIERYGLDKVLFMIEAAARMFDAEHKVFSLNDFDEYSSTASQYLEEIKNNCKYSGGDRYEPRKRVLFG